MIEAIEFRYRKPKRAATVLGAAALTLGIASCSAGNRSSAPVTLTPNMVGFLKPGTSDTCFNGGARPCALLLRVSPKLSSEYMNANPNQGRVDWPIEAYGGQPGDKLTVKCYDPSGQLVRPYEGNSSSTDWYEVEIPKSDVLNPAIQMGSRTSTLGWASIEWFNQSKPSPEVSVCAS
jgi:hypothetical protein